MQCIPCPLIWQPDNLAEQPANNFVALVNGLRASYPLVSIFTHDVDPQDETGYIPSSGVPAVTGITGPLSAWFGGYPTYSADSGPPSGEGSAIFTGAQGGLRADTAAMLNAPSIGITCWFKFSSKVGAQRVINYAATGGGTVFTLRYSSVQDRLNWHILDAGQAHEVIISAATLGSPAADTWYFAYCYYDASTKRAGVQIFSDLDPTHSLPATDEGAVPFGKNPSGGQFNIAYGPSFEFFKGKIYGVSNWARLLNPLEVARVAHASAYGWPTFTPAAGEASVDIEATAPDAPSNLVVSGDIDTISLDSFTDNNTPGTYSHEVWISDVTGNNWELVETLEPGITEGTWEGFNSDVQSVRVRAIGRGNPSDWATAIAPGAYFFLYGAVLLKADDEQWYFVRLETTTEEGESVTTLAIDPTPYSAPLYGAEFLSLLISGVPWGAHLVFDEDGHLQFEFVQDGETSALSSIDILSDDGQPYAVSLGLDDDNNPTILPAQTPSVS